MIDKEVYLQSLNEKTTILKQLIVINETLLDLITEINTIKYPVVHNIEVHGTGGDAFVFQFMDGNEELITTNTIINRLPIDKEIMCVGTDSNNNVIVKFTMSESGTFGISFSHGAFGTVSNYTIIDSIYKA